MLIKKTNTVIFVVAIVIVAILVIRTIINNNKLDEHGIYTLASLEKVESARGGMHVYFRFSWQNKAFTNSYIEDVGVFKENDIGKVYLMKFRADKPEGEFELLPEVVIPDSITKAPMEGWKTIPFK